MSTYVLLHGGAAGSWIWNPVERLLRAHGHEVLTVTFTGFAERKHLISADCSIELHVTDVVNALEANDITDAVLVAHSYSGTVAPGVIAAAPGRIRRVIFLDSVLLRSGESVAGAMGFMSPEQAAGVAAGVRAGAVPVEAPVAEQQRAEAQHKPFRMSAERQAWMLAHLGPMPTISNVNPVVVGAETLLLPADYIAVSDTLMRGSMHPKARALGFRMHEVEGDHAILVGEPEATAALIEKLS